ncbi:helix-turn-helix transcriptional regulator [Tuberibacillus sp. Marseille-P3662]|uniref:helix-turn-helix transcriptional regulator n=1 Tax=Tuberibacillus sp. Marseille-P3662 TaxID=1965358 RepID=UPI000A1CC55F|nr:helix-turn-helix transcriptional regulator [Tuberibacillus sp. Marseille-P3662]
MKFKCRLKIILWERGISQGEFAKRINVSQHAISSFVTGKSLPKFENVYRICEELDMKINEIWIKENE